MRGYAPFPKPWKSPVSYPAQSMAKLIREALDKLGWEYTRESGEKVYDRLMVIMPMMKLAHIYRFVVNAPIAITIDTYDTRPTHSSHMPWLVIEELEEDEVDIIKPLLDEIVRRVERPPWIFTLTQRVNHGALMPEFNKAKRAWSILGFDAYAKYKAPKEEKPPKTKRAKKVQETPDEDETLNV